MSLTFQTFQTVTDERSVEWRHGQPELPIEFSAMELGGEAGEVLNAVKKHVRHQYGLVGGKENNIGAIAEELGDVVICCALMASRLGIDLEHAVVTKFNKTSRKHKLSQRLPTGERPTA